jgi:hypothetical protein
MSPEQRHHYGVFKGYANRWQPVIDIQADLDAAVLEAEVLWGSQIRAVIAPLLALERELFVEMTFTVRMSDPRETREGAEAMQQILRARRRVLYQTDEGDAFATDVSNAIAAVETYVRPHLGYRQVGLQ